MTTVKKTRKQQLLTKMWRNWDPCALLWEQLLWENSVAFPQKIKQIQQFCFWVSQKNWKQDLKEITCTPTFTAATGGRTQVSTEDAVLSTRWNMNQP